MKKTFRRIVAALLVTIMLFGSAPIESLTGFNIGELFEVEANAAGSYPAIPALPISRVRQSRSDGMCYWSSMATVQGYCLGTYTYGGYTTSYRSGGTDYDFVDQYDAVSIKLNTYDGVADTGYNLSHFPVPMTLETSGIGMNNYTYIQIYNQLAQGKPVVLYTGTHASVVIAYNGSSSNIEASGFTVLEVRKDGGTWSNSLEYFKSYANNPQAVTAWKSPYVTLSSWLNYNGKHIKKISYPTNAPEIKVSVTLTNKNATNIKNTSATIGADFSQNAALQEYGYVISTKKDDVSVKLADANNRTDTATRDYVNNKSSETKKSVSMNVNKILGKNLSPNTTYYYRIYIKTNGLWFQSPVSSFTTANIAPGKSILNIGNVYKDIGIGDTATVSWSVSSNANSYTLKLYNNGNLVHTKENITGTTYAFPANCFDKAGEYEVKLSAKNDVKTVEMTDTVTLTVHDDVTVTFFDTVSNKTIDTQKVTYGHSATAPKNPSQYGYTFIKWDKAFNNLTADTTVSTVYEANEYTVKFVDGMTGQVYKTEKVKFNTAATAPEINAPTGYIFVTWDKDFSAIQGDTTIAAVYKWYNDNYPLATTLDVDKDGLADAVRNEDKNGYDVTVEVKNVTDEIVKGRLVVALKTESGYQYAETESSAFSISANSTKEISVFVPSDILAYSVEVYTINDYETSGVLATPVSAKADNSGKWSDWIAYTDKLPVVKGENGVTQIETKAVSAPNQYSYRLKEKTTSYATELSGWTQNGYSLEKVSSGTINYVKSWPVGFNRNNYYFSLYNKTPKTNSDTATKKVEVNDYASGQYIYWHWCRDYQYGPINRKISDGNWDNASEQSTFWKFHAEVSSNKNYDSGAGAYYWADASKCKDTYWWHRTEIRTQNYTIYNKLYNYYRWGSWTEYSETDPRTTVLAGLKPGENYQLHSIPGKITYMCRYKTEDLVTNDIEVPAEQIKNINGKVDAQFAGKEATVFVHKYTQPSDFTTEFVGKTTVGEDGSIVMNNIKLRQPLTVETGDFRVVASIEGNTGLIELQTYEAPKPEYTVTFYDYSEDGSTTKVIYQQTVKQGETVTAPSSELLTIPEGYKFARWNQSTVNVNNNLNVIPEIEEKEYVVVFVDWGSQEVQLVETSYGEIIEPPTAAKVDGKEVSWDMSNATAIEETLADGTTKTSYIVTQNTVITTQYTEKANEIVFIKPQPVPEDTEEIKDAILNGEKPDEEDVVTEELPHGDHIDTPADIENAPEYIFYGWRNIDTGELLSDTTVTESATYYPVYDFAYTVSTPYADIKTGEYDSEQTVTLNCDTEKAVIWYTTDGSDPVTSETAVECTAPIAVSKSCTIRFYATSLGMNDSIAVTELYAINNSAINYYIYSVYTNLGLQTNASYQAIIRENTRFDDSALENIEGYIYEGLFYDAEYTDEYFVDDELAFETTTLYAKYTPKKYTVKFLNYDGTLLSEQQINYGTSAVEPEVPERAGFVFVGWDSDGHQSVTEDGTYTAKFVKQSEYAKISFRRASTSRAAGGDLDLGAWVKITPDKLSDTPVSWTTSDPEIAEVDHLGNVTLHKEGTVVITATVDSNGEYAECTIKVTYDPDTTLVLGSRSELRIDSSGYIREVKTGKNTAGEIKAEFTNYDAETGTGLADTTVKIVDMNGKELSDDALVGTGAAIKLIETATGEELDSKIFIMSGDYDGDGEITNRDAARISRFTVDKEEPNLYQNLAMDVNGDGYVNNRDASMVSRYLVGKETI